MKNLGAGKSSKLVLKIMKHAMNPTLAGLAERVGQVGQYLAKIKLQKTFKLLLYGNTWMLLFWGTLNYSRLTKKVRSKETNPQNLVFLYIQCLGNKDVSLSFLKELRILAVF